MKEKPNCYSTTQQAIYNSSYTNLLHKYGRTYKMTFWLEPLGLGCKSLPVWVVCDNSLIFTWNWGCSCYNAMTCNEVTVSLTFLVLETLSKLHTNSGKAMQHCYHGFLCHASMFSSFLQALASKVVLQHNTIQYKYNRNFIYCRLITIW